MSVVLDTSALLAILFGEPGAEKVEVHLAHARMSSVNLAEAVSRVIDKGGPREDVASGLLSMLGGGVDPFDAEQAISTGSLRPATRAAGLSLGDRACLALALSLDAPVLTADRAWAGLDIGARIEVVR